MIDLLPAIDIVNGQAVRLLQGEAGTETPYGDPKDNARKFEQAGARWIHMVDLDAAFGRGSNADLIADIVASVDINIEVSGGLRDDESLARVLDAGAARVNLGTAAIENPAWTADVIDRYGDKIAVGLDVRGETLAGRGWTTEGPNVWTMIQQLDKAGCARYVVTDVSKDGTLAGPNIDLLLKVADHTDTPIVASGGVSTLDDIRRIAALADNGIDGVIVGKALYAGQFTIEQALAAVGQPLG